MKGKILKLFSLSLVLTIVLASAVMADTKSQYKLKWCDEFNKDSLDESKWWYQTGDGGFGNNEWQKYTAGDNTRFEDGKMIIDILKYQREDGKYGYSSTRINSSGKACFQYGKMEARIKLPGFRGSWPAFWMLGQYEPRGWPYCGEIDILETWNTYDFAQGTIHFYDDTRPESFDTYKYGQYNKYKVGKDFNKTDWHRYGINWTPKRIQFYVDDFVYYEVSISEEEKSELRKEFYFLLNCAVGGNLPGVGPEDDFTADKMEVDYVRVYQRESDLDSKATACSKEDLAEVPQRKVLIKDGEKVLVDETVLDGENFTIPEITMRKKYKFLGLYDGKTKLTANSRAFENVSGATKWEKINLKKAKFTSTKQKLKKCIALKFKASGKYDGFQVKAGKRMEKTKKKSILMGPYKSKQKYKVKVRTYAKDSTGKFVFGKWSNTKKVTVK